MTIKSVIVNYKAKITKGALEDFSGKVIGYDSENDEVMVELDEFTCVILTSDMIEQK